MLGQVRELNWNQVKESGVWLSLVTARYMPGQSSGIETKVWPISTMPARHLCMPEILFINVSLKLIQNA